VTSQLKRHVEGFVPAAVELAEQRIELLADARDLAAQAFDSRPRSAVLRARLCV
jgi:hypothetical protein